MQRTSGVVIGHSLVNPDDDGFVDTLFAEMGKEFLVIADGRRLKGLTP